MLNLSNKNLDVYKISFLLVKEVYTLTMFFPKEEKYGLVTQIRRAPISVCSNIAERASRISKKEKLRFYEISRSSVVEIDTQLQIAIMLNYYKQDVGKGLETHLESIFRMLSKMISNLETNPTSY